MDTVIIKVGDSNQVAYAKAKTHFSRPDKIFYRKDDLYETDNLFNALWEPQLTSISYKDKTGILGRDAL
jgi:hypothetical protein